MLDDASWLDQLTDLCTAARLAFGASAVSLAEVEHDHVRYVAAAGSGAEAIVGTELPLARGLAGYVAASGQALAIDEPASDPRFARDVAERTGYVPQTLLLVPVVGRTGSTVGVITRARPDGEHGRRTRARNGVRPAGRPTPPLGEARRQPVCSSKPSPTPSPRRARTSHRRCGERCAPPDTDDGVVAIAATLNTVRRLDPAARSEVVDVVDAVVALAGRRRGR